RSDDGAAGGAASEHECEAAQRQQPGVKQLHQGREGTCGYYALECQTAVQALAPFLQTAQLYCQTARLSRREAGPMETAVGKRQRARSSGLKAYGPVRETSPWRA